MSRLARVYRLVGASALVGAIVAAATTCGGDYATGPARPAALARAAGDGQSGTVGQALATLLRVKVADAKGAGIAGVAVGWSVTSGGGSVSPASSTTDQAGTATSTWTLGMVAGPNVVTARLPGSTSIQPVTFSANGMAGPAAQVKLTTPAAGAASGAAFATQPVATVQDAHGNTVTADNSTVVTMTVSSGAAVVGTATATASSGVATFTTVGISGTAGTAYTLTFASGSLTAATQTISPTAGAAAQLALTTPAAGAASGAAFTTQPVVAVKDAQGNTRTSDNSTVVTMTVSAGAAAVGTATATAASGLATFTNVGISGAAGTAFTLTFASGSLTSATQSITPAAGAASQLVWTQQPSAVVAGAAMSPAVTLAVEDSHGNVVAGASGTVTLELTTPGGATLTGGTAVAVSSGVATFSALSVDKVGTYTLTPTTTVSGVTTLPVSGSFAVSIGAATQIAVNAGNNQSAAAGTAVATAPSVIVRDAGNNPVAGVNVTFAVASGGGTVVPTTAVTTGSDGIAAVTSWTLGSTAGSNTLTATAAGLTGSPVTFTATGTAGTATQIALNAGNNQSATVGTAVATPPSVIVRDAGNNPISGVNVTFAVATGGGAVTGGAATTNASGIATVGSWTLGATAGSNTLTATSAGLTGSPVTFTATGTAGAATQIALNAGNNQTAVAGAAVSIAPSVIVKDANDNPVAGVNVTFAVASGGGSVVPTAAVATNASGIAAVTGWSLGPAAGSNTLTATATGLTGSPVTFTATGIAGAATQIALSGGNNQTATVGTAVATAPTVIVKDANSNPVANVSVTFAVTSGGGVVVPTTAVTTGADGIAAATSWTLGGTAGINTLTATSTGLAGSPVTFTATGLAGSAGKLALTTQPSAGAQSGVEFGQQPVIQLQDAGGNPVSQGGVVVTATIASGGGTLGGTQTQTTNGSGVATFTDLKITGTIGDRTLSFDATGLLSAISGTITVSAGPAAKLILTTQPSTTAQSGTALGQQPVVQLQDAAGNAVSQNGVQVTATTVSGTGTVTSNTATTNASGAATFSGLTLSGTSGSYTFRFTSSGLTQVDAANPTVLSAGTAAKLALTTQPSTTAASGTALAQQPVVQLQDASGNPVSQSNVTITATTVSGTGTLTSNTATTNASGAATFNGLTLSGTVGSYTFRFTAPSLTLVDASSATVLGAGDAAKLSLTTQPSTTAASGAALAQQPVVQLQDAAGNAVPQSGVLITATTVSGNGTLTSNTATTNTSGVASFSGLTLSATVGSYTFRFTASGLTLVDAVSPTLLSAGSAAKLALTTQPSTTAASGTALAQQPVVQIQDGAGNAVSVGGVQVTAATVSGTGTVTNSTASTNPSGVATFSGLTLSGTVGSYTFRFTAPSLTLVDAASATVLGAGDAAKLVLTTQPSTAAQSGIALGQQPVVQLQDASSNPVPQSGVVVTATTVSGTGTLTNASATTIGTGAATFNGLALAGTVGSYTFRFTAPSLTQVDAASPTALSPGAASTSTSTVSVSSGTVQSGNAVTLTLQAKDGAGNNLTSGGLTVAFTQSGGTSTGTISLTNDNSNGTYTATFTGALAGTPTTIGATINTVAVTTTLPTVTVTVGAATQIALSAGDGQSATVGTAVAIAPAVIVKDAGGNPVSGVGVTFAVLTGGGSVTGATPTTNASGIATVGSWTLGNTAGSNTLTATSGTLSGSPVTFTATGTAGPATQLIITTQPATTAASGNALRIQPVVQLADAHLNPVATSGTVVTATVVDSTGVTVTNTSATTVGTGAATFSGLMITVNGTPLPSYQLQFSAASLGTVQAVAATKLATKLAFFSGLEPSTVAVSGRVMSGIGVLVKDVNNNNVDSTGLTVTAAVTVQSGGVALTGNTVTLSASSNLALFGSLVLSGLSPSYTLVFSAPGLTSVTAAQATRLATRLVTNTQPDTTTASGVKLGRQPVIWLADSNSALVPFQNLGIQAQLVTPTGVNISGNQGFTDASGVVTFTDLTLIGQTAVTPLASYRFRFSSDYTPPDTASNTTRLATTLVLDQQPSTSATSDVPLAQQPIMHLVDVDNATVVVPNVPITATLLSGTAGVTITSGGMVSTDVNGVATFTGLTLSGPGTDTLQFNWTGNLAAAVAAAAPTVLP